MGGSPSGAGPAWVQDLRRLDVAVYAAVAGTETPALDRGLRKLSRAADYSRLSLASAALLGAFG
ncbi:MAG: phosphatase PAP2 family protein, partial [Thermoleophilaceae bacterium]